MRNSFGAQLYYWNRKKEILNGQQGQWFWYMSISTVNWTFLYVIKNGFWPVFLLLYLYMHTFHLEYSEPNREVNFYSMCIEISKFCYQFHTKWCWISSSSEFWVFANLSERRVYVLDSRVQFPERNFYR